MAKLIEHEVETAMVKLALELGPWTYGDMCTVERRITQPGHQESCGRIADKIMQRWRRKGWASFVRVGRTPLWALTESGRAMLSHEIAAAEEYKDGRS